MCVSVRHVDRNPRHEEAGLGNTTFVRGLIVIAVSGCYQPTDLEACAASCNLDTDCPGEFVCATQRCTFASTTCSDAGMVITTDGNPIDASPFAPNCAGLPTGMLPNVCFPSVSGGVIDLVGVLDTGADPRCDQSRTSECFIVGTSITVRGLDVSGSKPLVLWSASTIEVTGLLDVASHINSKEGPAASPGSGTCPGMLDGNEMSGTPTIGSGANGGSYAAAGGKGGTGRSLQLVVPQTQPPQPLVPLGLHGGCAGGNGGSSLGSAGHGGGAVYLMAHDLVLVSGTINASGSGALGGASGQFRGGGGGGGAGGLIAFDVPTLRLDGAHLVALGGGGGSGAATNGGIVVGVAGVDPDASGTTAAAPGPQTTGTNVGGAGGSILGALAPAAGDVDAGNTGGGGGGGGGAGFIVRYGAGTTANNPVVSPPIGFVF